MSTTLAAALGGAAGAVALVGVLIIVIRFCRLRKRNNSRSSETISSEPSLQELRGAWCFTLDEIDAATKSFSDINLIGYGKFGEVYKGLLHDGMVVAVKRRVAMPSREFIEEVRYISSIRQRNIVSLLGYCQENNLQMLIYEHIPNGSVSAHLYGSSQMSAEKLEFKHRLSIAHGAAKGLDHLHALDPPLIHKDFKTANVLVDEDFIAKVADAGLKSLLDRINGAGPSSRVIEDDLFLCPEVKEYGRFSTKSDVYSFGVFLLELVSGREARQVSESNQSINDWVQNYRDSSDVSSFVDHRMHGSFTAEGMREFLRLIARCLNPSGERRPPMNNVVLELDRIREKEMSLTTIMGESSATVTLGSQLFTK